MELLPAMQRFRPGLPRTPGDYPNLSVRALPRIPGRMEDEMSALHHTSAEYDHLGIVGVNHCDRVMALAA
jgi:hypothetical protein